MSSERRYIVELTERDIRFLLRLVGNHVIGPVDNLFESLLETYGREKGFPKPLERPINSIYGDRPMIAYSEGYDDENP